MSVLRVCIIILQSNDYEVISIIVIGAYLRIYIDLFK